MARVLIGTFKRAKVRNKRMTTETISISLKGMFNVKASGTVDAYAQALSVMADTVLEALPDAQKSAFLVDGKLAEFPVYLVLSGKPYKNQKAVATVEPDVDVENAYTVRLWLNHDSLLVPRDFYAGMTMTLLELAMTATGQEPRTKGDNGGQLTSAIKAYGKTLDIVVKRPQGKNKNKAGALGWKALKTPASDALQDAVKTELDVLRSITVAPYTPPKEGNGGKKQVRLFCVADCDWNDQEQGLRVRDDEIAFVQANIRCRIHPDVTFGTEVVKETQSETETN